MSVLTVEPPPVRLPRLDLERARRAAAAHEQALTVIRQRTEAARAARGQR